MQTNNNWFGYEEIEPYIKEHAVLKTREAPEYDAWILTGRIKFPLLIIKIECTNSALLDLLNINPHQCQSEHYHYFFEFCAGCSYIREELKPFAEHEVIKSLITAICKTVERGYIKESYSEEEDGIDGTITYYVKWPIKLIWHETATSYVFPKTMKNK